MSGRRWRWACGVLGLAVVAAMGCSTPVGAGEESAAERAEAQGVRTWEVRHAE